MHHINLENYLSALTACRQTYQAGYYAMYSSVLNGIVTDPLLMQLPADDHLVHRGDGVFDTCKCVDGAIYNLQAHLERLARSAAAIGIVWKDGMEDVRRITMATAAAAHHADCSVRVVMARGPGSFGVNPYESPKPSLYVIVYALGTPFMTRHPAGASAQRSAIPAKPPAMAEIKNCNYLPNVLMKREAVDWGVDFTIGYDDRGFLTEGATENIGLITADGELAFPRLENILAGTTMLRLVELAKPLTHTGVLRAINFRDISEDEVRRAAELFAVGTTINVAAIHTYENAPIGTGRPGPLSALLDQMLDADIHGNQDLRTVIKCERTNACDR